MTDKAIVFKLTVACLPFIALEGVRCQKTVTVSIDH